MRTIIAILKLELRSLYYSPISWLTLIIFTLHSNYLFCEHIKQVLSQQELFGMSQAVTKSLFSSGQGIFRQIMRSLFLYIPLITMGIFSKEYSRGTDKLLFSSPMKIKHIILGKYLSLLSFFLFLLLSLLPLLTISLIRIPNIDLVIITSGIIGLALLFCLYAAVGLFISALTSYSILAAIGTLATLFLFNSIGDLGKYSPALRDITFWLSTKGRTETLIEGLLCSDDILYFLTISFTFIWFTILLISLRQQKVKRYIQITLYSISILTCLGILKLVHIPIATYSYDATANKQNTLSSESIHILKSLKEPVKITTYVNMADYFNWIAVPSSVNADKKSFRKYLRFKPNISMDYVYYEAEPLRNSDYNNPHRLPTSSIAKVFCDVNKMQQDKLEKPWNITNIDLVKEKNSFVRLLELPSKNKSAVLRVFDDMQTHPNENEISLAFKALNQPKVEIGFISNISPRNLSLSQEIGYGNIISNKANRYATINQGFNVTTIQLTPEKQDIPQDVNILLASDFSAPNISNKNIEAIENYIDKGGNALILLGKKSNFFELKLLRTLGVSKQEGVLVYPQKDINPEIIPSYTTPLFSDLSPMSSSGECVLLPYAYALNYSMNSNFEVFPILQTAINKCALFNTEANSSSLDKQITSQPLYTTALALERKQNNNQQRIVIIANADFISNKELNTKRDGFFASNDSFFLNTLYWLSQGEAPLHIKKKPSRDNKINISLKEITSISFWIIYPLPILFLLCISFLLIRRNSA